MKFGELLAGHVVEVLGGLEDESIQCCVTSPPYPGQRVYHGNQDAVWGGEAGCEHKWITPGAGFRETRTYARRKAEDGSTGIFLEWGKATKRKLATNRNFVDQGGRKGNNPAIGIGGQVSGKSMVRKRYPGETIGAKQATNKGSMDTARLRENPALAGSFCTKCGAWFGPLGLEPTVDLYIEHLMLVLDALWPKMRDDGLVWINLGEIRIDGQCALIPERFIIAAQKRGWWVESKVVWVKLNPMPESTVKRPSKTWEMVYVLAKRDTKTVYRKMKQRKPVKRPDETEHEYRHRCWIWGCAGLWWATHKDWHIIPADEVPKEFIAACQGLPYYYDADAIREPAQDWGMRKREGGKWQSPDAVFAKTNPDKGLKNGNFAKSGRNARDYWETPVDDEDITIQDQLWKFPTDGYKGSHFAVFPKELPRRCIAASTRKGDLVLDPFVGAGTTPLVAETMGRRWVGIDISEDYLKLARERVEKVTGRLFKKGG